MQYLPSGCQFFSDGKLKCNGQYCLVCAFDDCDLIKKFLQLASEKVEDLLTAYHTHIKRDTNLGAVGLGKPKIIHAVQHQAMHHSGYKATRTKKPASANTEQYGKSTCEHTSSYCSYLTHEGVCKGWGHQRHWQA